MVPAPMPRQYGQKIDLDSFEDFSDLVDDILLMYFEVKEPICNFSEGLGLEYGISLASDSSALGEAVNVIDIIAAGRQDAELGFPT